jgi:hypothetical protein
MNAMFFTGNVSKRRGMHWFFSKLLSYFIYRLFRNTNLLPVLILNGLNSKVLYLVWLSSWAFSLMWDSELNIRFRKLILFPSLGKLLQFLYEKENIPASKDYCSVHNTATLGKSRKFSNINCCDYVFQSSEFWPDRLI